MWLFSRNHVKPLYPHDCEAITVLATVMLMLILHPQVGLLTSGWRPHISLVVILVDASIVGILVGTVRLCMPSKRVNPHMHKALRFIVHGAVCAVAQTLGCCVYFLYRIGWDEWSQKCLILQAFAGFATAATGLPLALEKPLSLGKSRWHSKADPNASSVSTLCKSVLHLFSDAYDLNQLARIGSVSLTVCVLVQLFADGSLQAKSSCYGFAFAIATMLDYTSRVMGVVQQTLKEEAAKKSDDNERLSNSEIAFLLLNRSVGFKGMLLDAAFTGIPVYMSCLLLAGSDAINSNCSSASGLVRLQASLVLLTFLHSLFDQTAMNRRRYHVTTAFFLVPLRIILPILAAKAFAVEATWLGAMTTPYGVVNEAVC
eukprot:gnl/MRDRNA2_/MRDRNA2_59414_c0_seq1.p1 gnl/MRDRNA2_/MRDRNA2_59414_c0~~gnl/MRDRNA2_/MRDRNA2_59414_c0_seq1.p1  ORF type:complete len:372 (+),score=44.63 gnl/MRDRNA2_/MRDRNA2_59414_c0_seq1:75-1190(+)